MTRRWPGLFWLSFPVVVCVAVGMAVRVVRGANGN